MSGLREAASQVRPRASAPQVSCFWLGSALTAQLRAVGMSAEQYGPRWWRFFSFSRFQLRGVFVIWDLPTSALELFDTVQPYS